MHGDPAAISRLVEDQRARIVSLAAFFTGSLTDAEDLAHDILLRLLQALPRLESAGTFDVWVYRLSRNRCVDHFRRRRFEAPWPSDRPEPAAVLWSAPRDRPDIALESSDVVRRLRAALGTLPPAWRRAVVLRDLQELSYEEVAQRLRRPLGTVKSQISRGRARLAAALVDALAGSGAATPPPRLRPVGLSSVPHELLAAGA
jgi:RNA polymerase sigma-70 factor, ECF subfamily